MGNLITTAPTQVLPIENYINDLADYKFDRVLQSNRFLKTARVGSGHTYRVVKVFAKHAAKIDISTHQKDLDAVRQALRKNVHAITYETPVETPKAVLLLRPYVFASLYDRMAMRPILSHAEKLWIAYQLIVALKSIHASGLCHGDIKIENVLLTSWNWAALADFSPFKPAFLPEDNPAGFSYFYDMAGRRTCNLAPERFYPPTSRSGEEDDMCGTGELLPATDIFALGCVIAELFTDGKSLFDLSSLLAYKKDAYDPSDTLARIEDDRVRALVGDMIAKNPDQRPSAAAILQRHTGSTFPLYFEHVLHPFFLPFARGVHRTADARVFAIKAQLPDLLHRFEQSSQDEKRDALSLLFNLVLACIRSLGVTSAKMTALELMLLFAEHASDQHRLERFLPYFTHMMREEELPLVRATALSGMVQLVRMVCEVQPTDANLFSEYILPLVKPFVANNSTMCRCTYANCLAPLAACARRFLDAAQSRYEKTEDTSSLPFSSFDHELDALRDLIQRDHLMPLLQDSSPVVREAFLASELHYLCIFLGTERTKDPLLAHLLTLMNDKRAWTTRKAFFKAAMRIAPYITTEALNQYLMPLYERALHDSEEHVVQAAIESLVHVVQQELFPLSAHTRVLDLSLPLIVHPNAWIRFAVLDLVATVAQQYPQQDAHRALLPALKPFLKYPIANPQDREVLATAVISHLSRGAYEYLVRHEHIQDLFDALAQAQLNEEHGNKAALSESHTRLITGLRNAGGQREDWGKILMLEDHIVKTRTERLQSMKGATRDADDTASEVVAACALGAPRAHTPAASPLPLSEEVVREGANKGKTTTSSSKGDSSRSRGGDGGDSGQSVQQLIASNRMSVGRRHKDDPQPFAAYSADITAIFTRKQHQLDVAKATQSLLERSEPPARPRKEARRQVPAIQVWRPKGIMVGHLHEHKGAVTKIAVSPDGKFFASASKDRSLRIWDCNKLEGKAVTNRSRFQFRQFKAGIRDIAFTGAKHAMAACSGDSIHLIDVKHANKVAIRTGQRASDREQEGAPVRVRSLAANTHHDSLLAFSTAKGVVGAWDTRMQGDAWTMNSPPGHGLMKSFVTDAAGVWMVTATTRGIFTLWDLRFLRPVKSWADPLGAVGQVELFPAEGDSAEQNAQATLGPKVMATVGDVVKVWDVRTSRTTAIFMTSQRNSDSHTAPSSTSVAETASDAPVAAPTAPHTPVGGSGSSGNDLLESVVASTLEVNSTVTPPASAQEFFRRDVERQLQQENKAVNVGDMWRGLSDKQRAPFLRSAKEDLVRYHEELNAQLMGNPILSVPKEPRRVVFSPEGSHIVCTGGADSRIHIWDTINPHFSCEMPQGKPGGPSRKSQFKVEERNNVTITHELEEGAEPRMTGARPGPYPHQTGHRDEITAFAIARAPNYMLISADREGVIKVWK